MKKIGSASETKWKLDRTRQLIDQFTDLQSFYQRFKKFLFFLIDMNIKLSCFVLQLLLCIFYYKNPTVLNKY
jgi:hypothetical protein